MAAARTSYHRTLTQVYKQELKDTQLNQQGHTPTFATIEHQVPAVRSLLLELAREPDGFITYGELVKETGTNTNYLSVVLGAIGHCEHRLGNPNLSALVVNSNSDGPAGGFFNWPFIPVLMRTNRPEGRRLTPEEQRFWKQEVDEVRRHNWES